MTLALCMARHRAQARADFRRFYALDFDDYAAQRPTVAADLLAMLPASSRTVAALAPESAPPDPAVTLCAIELDLRSLVWGMGGGKGAKPEPLTAATKAERFTAADLERIRAALNIPEGR